MAGEGRTWRTWQVLVVAAVALVIGITAGASTKTKTTTVSAGSVQPSVQATQATAATTSPPTTASATTAAPAPTSPPTSAGPKTSFSDGSYRVGVDIAPGTYRSSGTGSDCYWKRLSNFTGQNDILANYLSNSPTTVTILASDAGFETHRCGTWTKTA